MLFLEHLVIEDVCPTAGRPTVPGAIPKPPDTPKATQREGQGSWPQVPSLRGGGSPELPREIERVIHELKSRK